MAEKQVLEPVVKCLNCGIKINYKTDRVKKSIVRCNLVNVRKKTRRKRGRKRKWEKKQREKDKIRTKEIICV